MKLQIHPFVSQTTSRGAAPPGFAYSTAPLPMNGST